MNNKPRLIRTDFESLQFPATYRSSDQKTKVIYLSAADSRLSYPSGAKSAQASTIRIAWAFTADVDDDS